jgi:hypothetical protein
MKNNIKNIVAALILFTATAPVMGQLRSGMMVQGWFGHNDPEYVAEILTVNGKTITCRFVHSGSMYTLELQPTGGEPTLTLNRFKTVVQSNTGGKFGKGSIFVFRAYEDLGYCSDMDEVIVKFHDGKSFLGDRKKEGEECEVKFRHSGTVYKFNKRGVVLKSGGTYKTGSTATIHCAQSIMHD